MSTIPTGQFILIDRGILNDSSLTLPNNHTQGKKQQNNLSLFARDDDSKRMWNFIKGLVMRCLHHLLNIYYLTTWRPMTTKAITRVFLKALSLNILFLNRARCTTRVSRRLRGFRVFFPRLDPVLSLHLSPQLVSSHPWRCHVFREAMWAPYTLPALPSPWVM